MMPDTPANHAGTGTTAVERAELAKVIRLRAKVAKADLEARKADLLADFEQQMATEYEFDDARWASITAAAEQAVADARRTVKAELARACEVAGIPQRFAPQISVGLGWLPRNENAIASRRSELRKVAIARLDAVAKNAKARIDRDAVALEVELVASGLSSIEAREWLERLPTPDQLMPRLDLASLEHAVDEALGGPSHRYGQTQMLALSPYAPTPTDDDS
jgi:hypothetical protein